MSREYVIQGLGSVPTKLRRFRQGGLQTHNGTTWIDTNTISDANFGTLGVVTLTQVVTSAATATDLYTNDVDLTGGVVASEFGIAYVGTPLPAGSNAVQGLALPARSPVARIDLLSIDQDAAERLADIIKRRPHSATRASSYGAAITKDCTHGAERFQAHSNLVDHTGFITAYEDNGVEVGGAGNGRRAVTSNATGDPLTGVS